MGCSIRCQLSAWNRRLALPPPPQCAQEHFRNRLDNKQRSNWRRACNGLGCSGS